MQIPLFCCRCSCELQYDPKKQRTHCPNCDGTSPTKSAPRKAAPVKEPLTPAQKAIKAEYAPKRRAARFEGGAGLLVPEETPEAVIQERIMRCLAAAGWLVVRLNSGAVKMKGGGYLRAYRVLGLPERHASAGMPDVLAFKGTRALLVEVKDRTGHLRDSQVRFIEHARRFGVKVNVCRSWEDAQELVEAVTALAARKPTRARWSELLAIEAVAQREIGEKKLRVLMERAALEGGNLEGDVSMA